MEKIQVSATTSQKFSDDLTSVYELIKAYRNQVNSEEKQAAKSKSRDLALTATTVAMILIGGLYAALSFLPVSIWGGNAEVIRVVLQLMILLIYILGGASISLQYFSFKEIFKDFTGQVIGFASDTAKDEAALYEAFDELSTESIKYVVNRLDQASNQLGQLRSFLLGAIDKVGIIPGLLATILAISKVADSTGVSWVELLSVLMLGVYISMFPITEASIKTKRISVLLNQYLVLFRQNSESVK